MKKLFLLLSLMTLLPASLWSRERAWGWCQNGGQQISISGFGPSTTYWQQSFPSATVTVYATGTSNLATIYGDNSGTPKANPFTVSGTAFWFWYANDGVYDVKCSGTGIDSPFTFAAISLGGSGGGSSDATSLQGKPLNADVGSTVTPGALVVVNPDGDEYITQDKPVIDVRDLDGVDCTGTLDSSPALNTLLNVADSITNKKLYFPPPDVCALRIAHNILVFGQSSFEIEFGAPGMGFIGPASMFGCSADVQTETTRAVMRINRSGHGIIRNPFIVAKGIGCTSTFTGSLQIDNQLVGGGVTGTDIQVINPSFTTATGGTPITGYFGLLIGAVEGASYAPQNLERMQVLGGSIHCQSSPSSYGIWQTGANADGTLLDNHLGLGHCYQNARNYAGWMFFRKVQFNGGGFSIYGDTGNASIYCRAGKIDIGPGTYASEGTGQFLNINGASTGCDLRMIGAIVGADDLGTIAYPLDLGSTNTAVLLGNTFTPPSGIANACIGTKSNGSHGENIFSNPFVAEGNTCGTSPHPVFPASAQVYGVNMGPQYSALGEANSNMYSYVSLSNWWLVLAPTSAATSGSPRVHPSNSLNFFANYWNGSASTRDDWTMQSVPTTLAGISQLNLGHPKGITAASAQFNVDAKFGGGIVTVAATAISVPSVAAQGTTGATTYGYKLVGRDGAGTLTKASAETTIANGNATLTTTNQNFIQWHPEGGFACYDIYRTTGGATQGKITPTPICRYANGIGNKNVEGVQSTAAYQFFDTGLTGDGTSIPTDNADGRVCALSSCMISGSGSPEGVVVGSVGDIFLRTNGAAGSSIYFKVSGSATNTGWSTQAAICATCITSASSLTANFPVVGGGSQTSATLSPSFTTLTDGATITWAVASAFLANSTVTLGGNRTLNVTGLLNGGSYVARLVQDGTGSRTLTLGTGCTWKVSNGGAGSIISQMSTSANAIDVLAFTYDGTNCYASLAPNFN